MAVLAGATVAVGLCIGSFANVVIRRVPAHLSIVSPPSACPQCSARIRPRDNVPVVSWLVLRGRCRDCRGPISARYPLVEALTGFLFLLLALRFGWSWTLPAELAFTAGLVALSFCDLDKLILPKRIVYPTGIAVGVLLVVAGAAEGAWHRLVVAAICGAAAFVAFFAINLVNPRWMGFGDVRLAPVIGLALGWVAPAYAVIGFVLANALGAVIGIGLIASGRTSRRTALPFGVFLSAGAFLALLVSPVVLSHYSG